MVYIERGGYFVVADMKVDEIDLEYSPYEWRFDQDRMLFILSGLPL